MLASCQQDLQSNSVPATFDKSRACLAARSIIHACLVGAADLAPLRRSGGLLPHSQLPGGGPRGQGGCRHHPSDQRLTSKLQKRDKGLNLTCLVTHGMLVLTSCNYPAACSHGAAGAASHTIHAQHSNENAIFNIAMKDEFAGGL